MRGPCPHCLAGKRKRAPMKASPTPPAPYPGHTLCIDCTKLTVPSASGNKFELLCVDERSGRLDVTGSRSKTLDDLYISIFLFIGRFNSFQRQIRIIHVDAEQALVGLASRMRIIGIRLIPSPSEQHQQRIERYTQTLNNRVACTLSSLNCELPGKYHLQLKAHLACCINDMPNSASFPSTPCLLSTRQHPASRPVMARIPFGATVMVPLGSKKRSAIAKSCAMAKNLVPKSELGFCLGVDFNFPGQHIYVLANGELVPRRCELKDIVNCHPFDWLIKD